MVLKMYEDSLRNLRTLEPTSMAGCRGFNKELVTAFFDKYELILDEGQLIDEKITSWTR